MKAMRCSVRYFCFGSLMIFIGTVLLCSLGITIVVPYQETKTWTEADCWIDVTRYNESICSCNQQLIVTDCIDSYPCLQVQIAYIISNSTEADNTVKRKSYAKQTQTYQHRLFSADIGNQSSEAQIGDNQYHKALLFKTWRDAYFNNCSIHVCDESDWNVRETERFRRKMETRRKAKHMFTCYLNPDTPEEALLKRTKRNSAIHALFWPSLILFIGVMVWLGLYFGCWVIETEEAVYPKRAYIGVGMLN